MIFYLGIASNNVAVGICYIMQYQIRLIHLIGKGDYKFIFLLLCVLKKENRITAFIGIGTLKSTVAVHFSAENRILAQGVVEFAVIRVRLRHFIKRELPAIYSFSPIYMAQKTEFIHAQNIGSIFCLQVKNVIHSYHRFNYRQKPPLIQYLIDNIRINCYNT